MSIFSLDADVCGVKHRVSAESTAAGIVLMSPTGQQRARSLGEAVRLAAREIGLFLQRAENQSVPWGLHVSAGQAAAVYGCWPPLMGPPVDARPRPSLIARIRRLWRDGDGPIAALDNACKIIDAYTARARAA